MAHDVFISYQQTDKAVADAVCHRMEAAGVRCWIAPRDIAHGKTWDDAVVDALTAAKILVVIFSAAANAARDVVNEVKTALDAGATVMPFRIEDIRPTGALHLHLGRLHWLDALTPPLESHIDRLIDSAKRNLPPKMDADVPPPHVAAAVQTPPGGAALLSVAAVPPPRAAAVPPPAARVVAPAERARLSVKRLLLGFVAGCLSELIVPALAGSLAMLAAGYPAMWRTAVSVEVVQYGIWGVVVVVLENYLRRVPGGFLVGTTLFSLIVIGPFGWFVLDPLIYGVRIGDVFRFPILLLSPSVANVAWALGMVLLLRILPGARGRPS